ncbi:MAG: rRNA adenine N(6)-methyltransferase family protein [Candidatus Dormibacteria bacterium]
MAAGRRTARDRRRRELGQNFLRTGLAEQLIAEARVEPGEVVVDIGAGSGALSIACARRGATVFGIEIDPLWTARLRERSLRDQLNSLHVVHDDGLRWPLPTRPFRVVACLPFGITTAILRRLLDDPSSQLTRADLIVQIEVARKRSATPPSTLLSTIWAPWWAFELGRVLPARSFRPVPDVDAALLIVRRRSPPLLPVSMTVGYASFLRNNWPFSPPRS